jgi:hypothetical protein
MTPNLAAVPIWGIAVSFSVGLTPSVGAWSKAYFVSGAAVFAFTALVLFLWPFLARRWESFVAGLGSSIPRRFIPSYWISAVVTLVIAALGLIIA